MTYEEAHDKILAAIEEQPHGDTTIVDSEALYALVNRPDVKDSEPFTERELAMICEFSGLPESAVRGIEALVRMKIASR